MKKNILLCLIGLCFLALPVRAQISLLHEFSGNESDGRWPNGSLIASGSTLYGMTNQGGSGGYGIVFKIQIDGSDYTILHEFAGGADDGAYPGGSLIISDSTLYGMTSSGGNNNLGTVFKIEADGAGFTLLHEFAGGTYDGGNPADSLIISGSILFGMTCWGGDTDNGTIFRMQTDGSDFSLLHEFSGSTDDGKWPYGSLLLSESILYGMTQLGGGNDNGSIFRIGTDGSGFSLLHDFSGGADDGRNPRGSLILSGTTLYGMTQLGGGNDQGTIFKMENDGTGFILLHEFAADAQNGQWPNGSPIIFGSTLYGMTFEGGDSDKGTLFRIGTDGTDFALLHEFLGGAGDGANPTGNLILSGAKLYGMTLYGGDMEDGLVFSLDLDVAVQTISGTITSSGIGLAGVLIDGLPGTPITNGSGNYSTMVAVGWSGTATPTRQYFTFTPEATTYSSIDSDQATDYTATLIQPLVVTAPAASSQWEKGRTHPITWLKQGDQNANVKIALCKDTSTLIQMITTSTPNDGAFEWTVPSTMAKGSNYFIRVRTVDNLISDFSDKFSIIVPTITVISPTTGIVWLRNSAKSIIWNKSGTQDANVKIQLFKDTTKVLDITSNTPNNGSYAWIIPATLANGTYIIRVITLDGKVKGTSKSFSIVKGMIQVMDPSAGTIWQRGVAHNIIWNGEGTLNASVRIQLYKGTTLVKTIIATTPNDGSFDWTIPANQALAANYRVRVTTVDGKVTGQSGLFAVSGGPG